MPDEQKGPQRPAANEPQTTRLEKIVGQYTSVFDTWLTRYQDAVRASRNGRYTTEKWMSDVGAFWGDAATLVAFPLKVIDPETFADGYTAAAPSIDLVVDGTKDEIWETKVIADPGAGAAVEVNKLTTVSGDSIPPANVKINLTAGRGTFVVGLVGLKALLGGSLPKGMYSGRITVQGDPKVAPLAMINVQVK